MTAGPARRQPWRSRARRASTTEWLDLLGADGPFLAAPVVNDTWPSGLPALDKGSVGRLRDASARLDASPGTRDAFVRLVLSDFLAWSDELVSGPDVPAAWATAVPEYQTTVRADFALVGPDADRDTPPRLLGLITEPGTRAGARPRTGTSSWNSSPADRLAYALRAQRVPLGLVTDGTEWALVCAPPGGTTATATFTRHAWLDEPDTLKAFHALLGRLRFFGVPDSQTLPALLRLSLERQEEITERLSEQSRAVVEMLVATIGRADITHKERTGSPLLPAGVEPAEVYQAAVTVLMRLVFLLYAEERGLLPLDDDTYAATYAASTLAGQLREQANEYGENTLEQSSAAWHRILATSRAVHRGARHDQLPLPAYGGSLFDPDRFPWLEGRSSPAQPSAGASVLPIDDRTMLRVLEALQWLMFTGSHGAERRRVSFQALDVEQIGYVYEGLLDRDAVRADDWILGIASDSRGEREGPKLSLAELEQHLAAGVDDFAEWLSPLTKTRRGKRSPSSIAKALTPSTGDQAVEAERGVRGACSGNEEAVQRVLPFAGLLRKDPRDLPVVYPPGSLYLADSPHRATAGAVYTPRSLAEEVVETALAPLVYEPGPLDTEDRSVWALRSPEAILDLKVIDIAAGSGAFLVGATRYLAAKLLEARRQHEPASAEPTVDDEQRTIDARRCVLEHCIYGVDINPMALEMAKLSLWLVTLDRQRPFGFLDDRLAVGDSLLGLTSTQQLQWLHFRPEEGRRIFHGALPFWTADTAALLNEAIDLRRQIAEVELVDSRDSEHKARLLGEARLATRRLDVVADGLAGASLAGGEDHRFLQLAAQLREEKWDQITELARFALTDDQGDVRDPAHFPLLFPEVFDGTRTGFDCVIGNPPFLGGQKLTGALGLPYREHLVRNVGNGARGSADLVAYMFLTAAALGDRDRGQFGLIATNTVAQGDTREVGLDQVVAAGHEIYAAVKSEKWPTQGANLEYSIVWASRRRRPPGVRAIADGLRVPAITPSLDTVGRVVGNPHRLAKNAGRSFQGSNLWGAGFVLDSDEAEALINRDHRNIDVVFPYVNGEDLNSRPDCSPSRRVINFFDWSLSHAGQYVDCLDIVRERVKPGRDKINRARNRERWWLYGENRPGLYAAIAGMKRVLVLGEVSKTLQPALVPTGAVFSHMLIVFAYDDDAHLGLLTSTFHYWWAITRASTMRTDVRYTPSDCFETFPQPELTEAVGKAGADLGAHRRQLMLNRWEGLTATYNRVHNPKEEAADIAELRRLHAVLDQAVALAYGWDDLRLDHDFWETRQGTRFTISPEARVELLDRLLELNHARFAEEQDTYRPATRSPRRRRPVEAAGSPSLFGEEVD